MISNNDTNIKIAIVGASGFVGSYIFKYLKNKNYDVVPMVRKNYGDSQLIEIGDISERSDFSGIFNNIDVLIYTIARTHQVNQIDKSHLDAYKEINCNAMIRVAQSAKEQGVKRIIFLSSLKVLGEETSNNTAFRYNSTPNPSDAYGISKYEGEKMLLKESANSDFEVVIIRPPLIHGHGVKGNLASISKVIKLRIPIPLKGIKHNQRSLVSISNLSSLINACITDPNAKNKILMVKDKTDYSTLDIVTLMSKYLKIKPILIYLPPLFVKSLLYILGKSHMAKRLLGNLKVDDKYTQDTLNWRPADNIFDNQ